MKQISQAVLLVAGIGAIVAGVALMFRRLALEAAFQDHLLAEFHQDYHWRSIGDSYDELGGLGTVIVGALMMIAAAVTATWPRLHDAQPRRAERGNWLGGPARNPLTAQADHSRADQPIDGSGPVTATGQDRAA